VPADRRDGRGAGKGRLLAGVSGLVGLLDPPQPGLVELAAEQLEPATGGCRDLLL
jgi:hypothetical protein